MKNNLLFVFIFCAGIYCSAQNPVTFIPPKQNPTGKIDSVITSIDANTELIYVEVTLADLTLETGYILKGKKIGNHKKYFPNGVLMKITQYENDLINGIVIECEKNGTVTKEENYKLGKLDGVIKTYATSKGVRFVKTYYQYKKGMQDGVQKEYNELGKLVSESTFIHGKKDGVSKWYYNNGQISMEQNYKNEMIEGKFITYNQQGMVTAKGTYTNGKKIGTWIEYYNNGHTKYTGDYKDDFKIGTWKYFDENGTLIKTETF